VQLQVGDGCCLWYAWFAGWWPNTHSRTWPNYGWTLKCQRIPIPSATCRRDDAPSSHIAIGETADTSPPCGRSPSWCNRSCDHQRCWQCALREADAVIYLQVGPEIGVAATKTFIGQLVCCMLLAMRLGDARECYRRSSTSRSVVSCCNFRQIQRVLDNERVLPRLPAVSTYKNALYIARGINVPSPMRGSQLKEISYVHAEAMRPESETRPYRTARSVGSGNRHRHRRSRCEQDVTNVKEVEARDAPVIALVSEGDEPFEGETIGDIITVPKTDEMLSPFVNVVPCSCSRITWRCAVDATWISPAIWRNRLLLSN